MSWFSKGYDGVDKADREQKMGGKSPSRWWMPAGTDDKPSEKEGIFLDDDPFCIYEHNPKINGTFKDHWYTCVQGVWPEDPSCAMCGNKIGKYYVGFLTILDTSEWEYDGRIYKNMRRLFPAKLETLKLLRGKKKRKGTLAGTRWLISRTGGKAPNVGNDFEFQGEEELFRDEQSGLYLLKDERFWWTDKEGKKHPPVPFDYKTVLAPMRNADLARVLAGGVGDSDPASFNYGANASGGNAGSGGAGGGSGPQSPDEESVPY